MPGEGDVLVAVRAASVHPDVWHVMHGRPYALRLMGAGGRRPKNGFGTTAGRWLGSIPRFVALKEVPARSADFSRATPLARS